MNIPISNLLILELTDGYYVKEDIATSHPLTPSVHTHARLAPIPASSLVRRLLSLCAMAHRMEWFVLIHFHFIELFAGTISIYAQVTSKNMQCTNTEPSSP